MIYVFISISACMAALHAKVCKFKAVCSGWDIKIHLGSSSPQTMWQKCWCDLGWSFRCQKCYCLKSFEIKVRGFKATISSYTCYIFFKLMPTTKMATSYCLVTVGKNCIQAEIPLAHNARTKIHQDWNTVFYCLFPCLSLCHSLSVTHTHTHVWQSHMHSQAYIQRDLLFIHNDSWLLKI